jgi:hypothetical protein
MPDLSGLPNADAVERGVRDLHAGHTTAEALLVATAPTRLRELGVVVDAGVELPQEPELALYNLLGETHDDPYYRYNALRRGLDSFIAALQSRKSRRDRASFLR